MKNRGTRFRNLCSFLKKILSRNFFRNSCREIKVNLPLNVLSLMEINFTIIGKLLTLLVHALEYALKYLSLTDITVHNYDCFDRQHVKLQC